MFYLACHPAENQDDDRITRRQHSVVILSHNTETEAGGQKNRQRQTDDSADGANVR